MVQPRHHTPRSDRPTKGGQVAKIAQAKRAPLMPWQRDAVDVALEVDPATGLYHYGIVVVSVPRQSGKTKLESDVADHRCLTIPRARVWITMQNGKTVDEWMREEHFASLASAPVFGVPGSASCRYQLSKRAGSVGVKWPARGSTFTTFPPTREALHSKQSDLVFVDEAWAHDTERGAAIRQAIRPTMATRPGSQLWVVSTEGDDSSTYLEDYLTLGRESLGRESRVCFVDYGIPDDADPEDIDVIAAHHPAYGHTQTRDSLEAAKDDFAKDPAGWARAYGNRRTRTRDSAFPPGLWAMAGTPRVALPERAGIALDATPDGTRFALGAQWERADGHRLAEVIDSGDPARDTPAYIAQVVRAHGEGRLIVDRGSVGAVELVDAIARHDPAVEIEFATGTQYAAASGSFYRGIIDATTHHFNDPDLDAAAEIAVKVDAGDGGFRWGRKHANGSVAELVAVTLAGRALDTLPAPLRRPVAHV